MGEEQKVYPNDTTREIRKMIEHIKSWSKDNDVANKRIVAMILTKLQEAELLSLLMVIHTGEATLVDSVSK